MLVAEDDDSRETVVALLSAISATGCSKLKDAHSALNIIESGMPIDGLLTDVMPGP